MLPVDSVFTYVCVQVDEVISRFISRPVDAMHACLVGYRVRLQVEPEPEQSRFAVVVAEIVVEEEEEAE